MLDVIPSNAVRLLPTREAVIQSYRFVFGHPYLLARAVTLPFLIELILRLGAIIAPVAESWISHPIWECLDLIPATFFGVAWHRLTLLGLSAGSSPVFTAPERRHLRFYLYALVITLVYFIPVWIVGAQEEVVANASDHDPLRARFPIFLAASVFGLVMLYVTARLSFVFPAASVDEKYGFGDSWRHTRRQGFRILILIIAMYLPVAILFGATLPVLGATLEWGRPSADPPTFASGTAVYEILRYLLAFVSQYLPMALMVSAISLAFKTCTGWVRAEDKSARK